MVWPSGEGAGSSSIAGPSVSRTRPWPSAPMRNRSQFDSSSLKWYSVRPSAERVTAGDSQRWKRKERPSGQATGNWLDTAGPSAVSGTIGSGPPPPRHSTSAATARSSARGTAKPPVVRRSRRMRSILRLGPGAHQADGRDAVQGLQLADQALLVAGVVERDVV